MKLKAIIFTLLLFPVLFLSAAVETDKFVEAFEDFSETLAPHISTAATLGNTWSDAYIGQLLDVPPHFGAGATVAAVMIPGEGFGDVIDLLGLTVPSSVSDVLENSIPFPVYTLEGRIGGFMLPFDLGLKFGTLPEEAATFDDLSLSYTLVGADIRVPILKENLLIPDLSVGFGYNYLKGGVFIDGLTDNDVVINTSDIGGGIEDITVTDPDLKYEWEASVFDLKLQVSKNLLLLRPYAGLGVSYAVSSVGGGLYSDLRYGGTEMTNADLTTLKAAYTAAGLNLPDIDTDGVSSFSDVTGMTHRVYGGASFALFLLHLDVSVFSTLNLSDFSSTSWGGSLNARIQL